MTIKKCANREVPVQTVRDRLRIRLEFANTLATNSMVESLVAGALNDYERLPRAPLVRCAACGQAGLPERIAIHDCS